MYKYIGIRGHRGSGKSSISYLMAAALDFLKNHGDFNESFDSHYQNIVSVIKTGQLNNLSFNNVHIETFADSPIALIHLIFGIPMEYCYDDEKKDTIVVNLRTFEYQVGHEKFPDIELVTAKEYFEKRNNEIDCECSPHKMKNDVLMTLRELISYYGNYVMKYFFGANVWIKSLRTSEKEMEDFYASDDDIVWKVYSDVKFTSEVDYIKSHNGVIICLNRPGSKKDNFDTSTNLTYDTRMDYVLEYDEICNTETCEKIKQIAKQIYEN